MGEVADIVRIYIEDSDILEEKVGEISHSLEENIKNIIPPGSYGYDQGYLHDSIVSHHATKWPVGLAYADYHKEYGKYIDQGTPPVKGKLMKMPWGYRMSRKGIKAVKFMERGLKQTLEMYK